MSNKQSIAFIAVILGVLLAVSLAFGDQYDPIGPYDPSILKAPEPKRGSAHPGHGGTLMERVMPLTRFGEVVVTYGKDISIVKVLGSRPGQVFSPNRVCPIFGQDGTLQLIPLSKLIETNQTCPTIGYRYVIAVGMDVTDEQIAEWYSLLDAAFGYQFTGCPG